MLIVMIILLAVAVSRTNYGIWDADIPFGDDAVYIDQAFQLSEKNQISSSLYLNTYILVFKYVSADPIIAHYCVRYLSSLLSVIALFLLLSSLSFISELGAFVMALLWSLNLLNSPLIQFVNINLFVFALVCFAGYLWLSNGRYSRFASIGILLVAIIMRYEYSLLLFFLALQQLWVWRSQSEFKNHSRRQLIKLCSAVSFVLIILTVFALNPNLGSRTFQHFPDLNSYFFLGFTQHYSVYTVSGDATLRLDPYTEYDLLINERFPGATDFFSAVRINSGEVIRYLSGNLMSNLTRLHYVLPSHGILLPSGLVTNGLTGRFGTGEFVSKKFAAYPILWLEQALSVMFIAGGALWLLARNFRNFKVRHLIANDDAVFIIGMAAVASVSFILHMPDPRYWIMTIPLVYWGAAALTSKYCHPGSYRAALGLALLFSLVIVNPVFTSTMNRAPYTNKDVALALREKLSSKPEPTTMKVLGYYPKPLLTFAAIGRGEFTDNIEVIRTSSYEKLIRAKTYDLVIIDNSLKNTWQYNKEQLFFEKMLQDPAEYGYEILLKTEKNDGPVWIFQRAQDS